MPLLYDLGTGLYHAGVRTAAPFVPKARAWVDGRKGLWQRLEAKRDALQGCLWMHCASVGEFEQGRPVLEAIKAQRPDLPVLLTFFSPSGYEARKGLASAGPDSLVTHVDYLPPDGAANAQRLTALLAPRLALFVKYEFWYHHLNALAKAGVPTCLVSAVFRPDQPFFRWYGATHRRMLRCFTHIFTQDPASQQLLAGVGITAVTVSGDTRFDRVVDIAQQARTFPFADHLSEHSTGPLLLWGSTWPADERIIAGADIGSGAMMIVPHEVTPEHTASIRATFDPPPMVLSEYEERVMGNGTAQWNFVLVDRMGMLASLYRYADVAYVGGGFTDGIHNLLEAAVWGTPVIFGPQHTKFPEAQGLIDAGAGFEVRDSDGLGRVLEHLRDPIALGEASVAAERYVRKRTGATRAVMQGLAPFLR